MIMISLIIRLKCSQMIEGTRVGNYGVPTPQSLEWFFSVLNSPGVSLWVCSSTVTRQERFQEFGSSLRVFLLGEFQQPPRTADGQIPETSEHANVDFFRPGFRRSQCLRFRFEVRVWFPCRSPERCSFMWVVLLLFFFSRVLFRFQEARGRPHRSPLIFHTDTGYFIEIDND